jgi:hypothetical protein
VADLETGNLPAIERRRTRSLVERDMATAEALHAPEYELITPGGAALSRSAYLGGVERGELRYHVFEPASEVRVVQLASDAAAVRYRARIEIEFDDNPEHGLYWHTDLYALRDGQWQAVWSHATRIREEAMDGSR